VSGRAAAAGEAVARIPGQDGPDGAALLALLPERAPIYEGVGSAQAERIRAQVFEQLAAIGAPPESSPYILEELESGIFAPATAAAALALASLPAPPAVADGLLLKAVRRHAAADLMLPFPLARDSRPSWTAVELLLALLGDLAASPETADALADLLADEWLPLSTAARAEGESALARIRSRTAGRPACCGRSMPAEEDRRARRPAPPTAEIMALQLEDQDGLRVPFGDFFAAGPSILAFFYTRCMNPERCSLTVSKLARLQARFDEVGAPARPRIGCISYDPEFDRPRLLHGYGSARGFRFDPGNRFFRTIGPLDPLHDWLELGVGYGPSTVNRHRIELHLLGDGAEVVASFTRRLWDEDEVIAALAASSSQRSGQTASIKGTPTTTTSSDSGAPSRA
jgi:protein SCO1/2